MKLFEKLFGKKKQPVPVTDTMEGYVQSDAVDNAWSLWGDGKIQAPERYLLDYIGGINGEGHNCFIDNNESEIDEMCAYLTGVLPEEVAAAFSAAVAAYKADKKVTKTCDAADETFHRYERAVMEVLENYAKTL